jgi:aldehyde dehydrogenase (NAD+)
MMVHEHGDLLCLSGQKNFRRNERTTVNHHTDLTERDICVTVNTKSCGKARILGNFELEKTQEHPDIDDILAAQRRFFQNGESRPIAVRMAALKRLRDWLTKNEEALNAALYADLGKSRFEVYATELGIVLDEIRYALRHMKKHSRDRRCKTPDKIFPSRSFVRPCPYGVVLIISPWNYPCMLSFSPLVGAIAAGNCAVVKPSAYAPHSATLVAQCLAACFAPEHVTAVLGGRKENAALLARRFDYIFFTGSLAVGKAVLQAAAVHVTPVTLELGGKSPCVVDETAHLRHTAKRIIWGKFVNAGQTCLAPDYVLVQASVKEQLLIEMRRAIREFYGEKPLENPDYAKIINDRHFVRLRGLLEGQQIVTGGASDPLSRKIEPTILDGVSPESPVMQDEIFGPILPVLCYEKLPEAVAFIRARPHPLALYAFTRNKAHETQLLDLCQFGGGCVNDVLMHVCTPHMPFGGVGESGMGRYHGRHSFETFSHQKSILKSSSWVDIWLRYPPYANWVLRFLKILVD